MISYNITGRRRWPSEVSNTSPSFGRTESSLEEAKNMPDAPDGEDEDAWMDDDDPTALTANDRLAKLRMANLVKQYLKAQELEVLIEGGMEDAVMRFVEKDDRDAIKESVSATLPVALLVCELMIASLRTR